MSDRRKGMNDSEGVRARGFFLVFFVENRVESGHP